MRFSIFTLLLCISVYVGAQTKWYKDGAGFNSYFQKLDKGHFIGTVNGILQFETEEGNNYSTLFSKDTAFLEIRPDPNEIYDVSYKTYLAKNSDIQFEYSTYNYANALFITKDKRKYQLSLFDGACKGLLMASTMSILITKERNC